MNQDDQPSEPLSVVDRVRVQFGSLVAVRDVSFELRAGDLLGLIGPNGAGKTTLLRAMCGLQSLDCGCVHVLGEALLPSAVRVLHRIGFTPDTPTVYEELTVREFLRFIAKAYHIGSDAIEERIDFWLEQVWLTEKMGQKIKALSRGMRQRVAIARTLLPNPTVILLDEPAAGIDPAGRVQLRQLLCNLRAQGKALVVSSHILADLNEYCTHIAIMAQGSIIQFGSVAAVAGGADDARCRYTLILARPVAGLRDVLEKIAGVRGVEADNDRAVFEYASRREDAADLLARLVGQGIPVASFAPNLPGLEEAYMRTGIRQVD